MKEQSAVRLPTGADYLQRREPHQPLSELLASTNPDVVVLAHPNDFHTPDAEDLASHGHKVAVEKPYALTAGELSRLGRLVESGNVGLLMYYLFGKTPQLHILSGAIPSDSFFLTTPGLLTGDVDKLQKNAGLLENLIGDVSYIHVDLLEGDNQAGGLLHRHESISIGRLGGGVINDDGIHCFALVTALGKVMREAPKVTSVSVAVCEEHQQRFMAKGYKAEDIAETYADVELQIGNTPAHLVIGKYVMGWPNNGRNHRRLLIIGTKGKIDFDLSNCVMAVYEGDSVSPGWMVGVDRDHFPRYYGVIRAAVEGLEGKFENSLTPTILEAQAHVLSFVNAVQSQYRSMPLYKAGAEVREINRIIKG